MGGGIGGGKGDGGGGEGSVPAKIIVNHCGGMALQSDWRGLVDFELDFNEGALMAFSRPVSANGTTMFEVVRLNPNAERGARIAQAIAATPMTTRVRKLTLCKVKCCSAVACSTTTALSTAAAFSAAFLVFCSALACSSASAALLAAPLTSCFSATLSAHSAAALLRLRNVFGT